MGKNRLVTGSIDSDTALRGLADSIYPTRAFRKLLIYKRLCGLRLYAENPWFLTPIPLRISKRPGTPLHRFWQLSDCATYLELDGDDSRDYFCAFLFFLYA